MGNQSYRCVLSFSFLFLFLGACDRLQPSGVEVHQPIVGMHAEMDCDACHGETLSQAPQCTPCHEQDRLSEDHHPGQECGSCHLITGWGGLDHEHQCKIPHEGYGECTDCHLKTTDTFSCTHCHAHGKTDMEDEHRGKTNNFVWESTACLECHSTCKE